MGFPEGSNMKAPGGLDIPLEPFLSRARKERNTLSGFICGKSAHHIGRDKKPLNAKRTTHNVSFFALRFTVIAREPETRNRNIGNRLFVKPKN